MTKTMTVKAALAGLGLAAFAAAPALAETWEMPTPYPDATFHTQNIRQFAEDVEAATNGALTINVHSAGSLFKHPEIKNAVRSRQVPIGEFILSQLANEDPVFQADSIPFLATSYEDAERLWQAQKPKVEEALAEQNLMVLFTVPWPPQGLYTNKPVESVDDMRGLKFRAYNSATERLAQLAGAVPTQVEVPDIPQAFATGRVEAMMTSPSTGANSKAWDFLSHYYDVKAWLPKNVVVVNERSFRALPEDVRQAVLDAAAQAQERGWQMSREETEAKTQVLRDNGLNVQDPSPELKAGLQDIGEQMAAEWAEAGGEDVQQILDAYRAGG